MENPTAETERVRRKSDEIETETETAFQESCEPKNGRQTKRVETKFLAKRRARNDRKREKQ